MYISRIVVRNLRNFSHLDVKLEPGVSCVIGENNTGKTNLLHGIRLAIDANLSSRYRQLIEHDIYSGISISTPQQVLVSVEFRDFSDSESECALVGCCEITENIAQIIYRFRPRSAIREAIENEEIDGEGLTLDDYHWELTGGGGIDPATVSWDNDLGSAMVNSSNDTIFLYCLFN
jgi:putative ATP-dependent endonuclease of OLD family